MTGLGALAVGAAPLAGGLLLGGMAGKGNSSVADLRAVITSELDLLQQLPEAEVARRAALKRMIGEHVDALLVAQEKSREFQSRTRYFTEEGHWRDIVLFVTILLFAVITWHADHHRPVWLPLFIATLVMSVIVAVAVVRGFLTSIRADEGTTTCATATTIPSAHADRGRRFSDGPDEVSAIISTPGGVWLGGLLTIQTAGSGALFRVCGGLMHAKVVAAHGVCCDGMA